MARCTEKLHVQLGGMSNPVSEWLWSTKALSCI